MPVLVFLPFLWAVRVMAVWLGVSLAAPAGGMAAVGCIVGFFFRRVS